MKLGVFGGTFDPPHVGHLVAAQELCHQVGLDRLVLVPAALPPHKHDLDITPGWLRLEMLKAAVGADPRFQVSDLELRRAGPSYTVDTLRQLRDANPGARLFLAIGADQLAEFDGWKSSAEVRRLATLVAFARPGAPFPADVLDADVVDDDVLDDDVLRVEVPAVDISSTEIRRRVAAGKPIAYLVPAGVVEFIEREGLYR